MLVSGDATILLSRKQVVVVDMHDGNAQMAQNTDG
jgi:hypothetical protein